jgi:hypothetical protein
MKQYILILLAAWTANALPDNAASLLKRHAGFTDEQISAVARGSRVVRALPTARQEEVAFAGATRLSISLGTYLNRLRAGTLYRAGENIIDIGRFGESPAVSDLKTLSFESYDLGPGTSPEQNKRCLIAWIRNYERTGAIGVGPLGEPPRPVDAAARFEPMVREARYLREQMPAALDYLVQYPNIPARGDDDFFIWTQLTFGLRPITRLAHVAIWEQNGQAFVVTKQIYANRYFEASFQIDHLISDGNGVYLITLNYGRSELLHGFPGRMVRPVVVSRTVALAGKTLDRAVKDLQ